VSFHTSVIERKIRRYSDASGVQLRPVSIDRVREIVTYIEGRKDAKGRAVRPRLTPELSAFIANERAMCKASFLYWAERYAFIEFRIGEGGVKLFKPLESQFLLIEKMAAAEREMWERKDAGDVKFLGLCFIIHKARQLGFTTLCQLILTYLNIFYSDYKSLSASVDDQKTQDMHAKWMSVYERLPWWMQVEFTSKDKERGKWLANGSYAALQDFSQEGGLGQGMTWSGVHLTELAAVDDEYCRQQVQNHLLPSIADTIRVVGFMESTAQGAGNWWHQVWQQVDTGRFGRWRPAFIPAYAEPHRWSRPYAPDEWQPNEETRAYEAKIVETSPKYMNGRTVRPSREHLIWWEEERQVAIDSGTLNLFLANYCVTPEESFQYSQGGAFNPQILVSLQNRATLPPVAYELITTAAERMAVRDSMNVERDAPRILSAGPYDLVPVHTTERDEKDPRGLVLLYEPPRLDVLYSLGADPAVGLVGWNRRTRSDTSTELNRDNACASGWYRDPRSGLSLQAFEFAGPIAPREFARYLYALGRVYSGAHGPEQGSPIVIEVNNGGTEVQNVLINDYRYYALWRRTSFNGVQQKQLDQWGWLSTRKSVPELWIYGKDVLEQPTLPIRPRSLYLIEEMGLARWDAARQRGEVPAGGGKHDDRISAMLLALWQLRSFMPSGAYADTAKRIAEHQKRTGTSFQNMDLADIGEYDRAVDEWYTRVMDGW
jgi:hypothetical protein